MQKTTVRGVRKKGFTLVELLIVIIIIGVMSSMMMISTGSATDKAEATRIVSDLRNIQSASVLFFADEEKWPVVASDLKEISDYLTVPLDNESKYSFVAGKNGGLNAQYKNEALADGVWEKLDAMQKKGTPISMDSTLNTVELVIRN